MLSNRWVLGARVKVENSSPALLVAAISTQSTGSRQYSGAEQQQDGGATGWSGGRRAVRRPVPAARSRAARARRWRGHGQSSWLKARLPTSLRNPKDSDEGGDAR